MLSTKHVVLGLVIERAGYGYELQQRIDRRLGFLGLSDSVIYGVLDRLENDGLIVERGAKPMGRTRRGSPRLTYSATDAGVDEFRRWIAAPPRPTAFRDELYAKLAVSGPEHVAVLVRLTEELERHYLEELQELTGGLRVDPAEPGLSWAALTEMLVDDACATRLQSTIGWLQRTRVVLQRRLEASP